MADEVEDIAESQWRDAFRARVREAQGDRKDKDTAKLLGIIPERYRKYVGGGASRKTVIPVRLLTRFCLITDRPLEWLIDGPEEQINKQQKPRKTQPSMKGGLQQPDADGPPASGPPQHSPSPVAQRNRLTIGTALG